MKMMFSNYVLTAPTATPDERARAAAAASGNSNAGNSSNPAGPGVFKSFRPGVYPGAGMFHVMIVFIVVLI